MARLSISSPYGLATRSSLVSIPRAAVLFDTWGSRQYWRGSLPASPSSPLANVTEPLGNMDQSLPPGEFHLSAAGAIRGDVKAPSPRVSGELRIRRTSNGASRALGDDERPIPVLRNADGPSTARTSASTSRLVLRSRSAIANRVVNVTLAILVIIVLAPVFVIVALLVRL